MTADYLTPPPRKMEEDITEKNIRVVLYSRIEYFNTLEDAAEVSTAFIKHIPSPDELLYKVESTFYRDEPRDNPYFTIEATYYFESFKEAFSLLKELNVLELKEKCNQFIITLKNFK